MIVGCNVLSSRSGEYGAPVKKGPTWSQGASGSMEGCIWRHGCFVNSCALIICVRYNRCLVRTCWMNNQKIGISPGSQLRVGLWRGENFLWFFSLSPYWCWTDCGTRTSSNRLGNVDNTPQMGFFGSFCSTPPQFTVLGVSPGQGSHLMTCHHSSHHNCQSG